MIGCNWLDDKNDSTNTDAGGYLWAKTMLHDLRLHGILGFSGQGWTGEDWVARIFTASQVPIVVATTDKAVSGSGSVNMADTREMVSESEESIGDIIDFPGNLARTVKSISGQSISISPSLGNEVPAKTNSFVRTSISRAWRAWMRTESAKNAGKGNLPNVPRPE